MQVPQRQSQEEVRDPCVLREAWATRDDGCLQGFPSDALPLEIAASQNERLAPLTGCFLN